MDQEMLNATAIFEPRTANREPRTANREPRTANRERLIIRVIMLVVTTAAPDEQPAPRVRRGILPPSYERSLGHAERIELASDRPIRERNKISYRFAHWPIWIFVFFIAPGPLTFDLFAHGFDARMALWLGAVLVGHRHRRTSRAAAGVEPRPYIIRFTEDRPNPLYRRVCYTLAWSEVIAFALLNITGLVVAIATGAWRLRQMYDVAYFPIVVTIWLLGVFGQLPRVKASTQNEGHERRYFYGSSGPSASLSRCCGFLASLAAIDNRRRAEAGGLHRDPCLRRQHGPPWPPPEDPADRAG